MSALYAAVDVVHGHKSLGRKALRSLEVCGHFFARARRNQHGKRRQGACRLLGQ